MRRSCLSVIALAGAAFLWRPAPSPAGEPTLQRVTLASTEYLFFEGEMYYPGANFGDDEHFTTANGQMELRGFSASLKTATAGVQDVPALKFEVQGKQYIIAAHQIVVLGPRPKQRGLFVETRPDPNGSGNVEVLIVYNAPAKEFKKSTSINYSNPHEHIEILNQGQSSSQADSETQWEMKLVLRNTSDDPFTLTPDFFNNLPGAKDWPVIVIPVAK